MRGRIAPALLVLGPLLAVAAPPPNPTSLDAGAAARFAALALRCLHREYPNHISHTLGSAADARPPRELTPAFYGCYDWHTAIGCWCGCCGCSPTRRSPLRRAPKSHAASPRPTSPAKSPTCAATAARPSSAPTGSRGCCSWRRSCAAGMTRMRSAGPRLCSRSSRKRRRGSRAGCRSFTTRSASVSTTRPLFRSGSPGTGLAWPGTMRCARC